MASLSAGNQIYLCHFCSREFSTRPTLLTHFSHCEKMKQSTKQFTKTIPQLTQIQVDILLMVQLHPSHSPISENHSSPIMDINLQIPLTHLYSHGYLPSSNQSSFDDSCCTLVHSQDDSLPLAVNEEPLNSTPLSSYHIYKYSRRERDRYNSRLKRTRMKKHFLSSTHRKSSSNERISSLSPPNQFLIHVPTKINSQLRTSSTSHQLYPLLFCPNFSTLVKLPIHPLLAKYFVDIRIAFHLLHSIASQEFQIIVHNSDHQHDFSYTSLSVLNMLRQTIFDCSKNFHRTYKRDSLHLENPEDEDEEHESNHELSIPPLKIRRHDDSSYEIDKRSTSSSSSGMSITQIHNGHSYEDRRRCLETRSKKFSSRISDMQINSNSNDTDKKDLPDFLVGSPSFPNDSFFNDHQQWKDRTSSKSSHQGVISVREQANDSLPKYQSVVLNEGARIRIVNCSNDSNKHSSTTRNSSLPNPSKKKSNSMDKLDENWSTKSTRINTRKISSTNSKTSDVSEISPSYQTQSVLLSDEEIAQAWSIHNVFYRCHACCHEEFFMIFSRECMRLHVSSKHGNMEENFKQRLSNFLNNQGRALKIFQHYLKWQQPWSETEIDQIFQSANITKQSNGAL